MQVIDIINEAIESKRTRFAFELLPPLKGDGTQGVFKAIDPLIQFDPAYINVTFHREDVKYVEHPSGLLEKRIVRRRPGTIGVSAAIMKKYGVEVVPHLICGGHSRYDIEDYLIDLDFLGINNVLAMRGDNAKGDHTFRPNSDGHSYAQQLVEQIVDMNRGQFIDGEVDICQHSQFCVGVAGYPEKHADSPNYETDMRYLKAKVDAGAEYIITQMCFDNKKLFDFIERCRLAGITVPIVPGIKPFSTKAQLTMLPHIFHVDLPQDLVVAVESCRDNKAVREVGAEWAIEQIKELKAAGLPIVHLYTMGKTDNIEKIAKAVFV